MDAPKDCETYASQADFEAQERRLFAKARSAAAKLPFDYRELVHALLVDYLAPSKDALPGAQNRYFVSVLGVDVDSRLTKTLAEAGVEVLPYSRWTLSEFREGQEAVENWQIEISAIEQLTPERFKVSFGYYCGPLCASGLEYELERSQGRWLVVDRKRKWAS